MAKTETHVFRVSLGPKIYRDFEIISTKKLDDLAGTIVQCFGFDLDHAFGFYSLLKGNVLRSPVKYELFADMGESDARSVKRSRIVDAFPEVGDKMTFLFDYGDEWRFLVEVIGRGSKEAGVSYPRRIKTVGEAPKQYPDPDDLDDE